MIPLWPPARLLFNRSSAQRQKGSTRTCGQRALLGVSMAADLGAGRPFSLMRACLPAFYGSKPSRDVRPVTAARARLQRPPSLPPPVPSPLTRFPLLSRWGLSSFITARSMLHVPRALMFRIGQTVLQHASERPDWWTLHSGPTDTLVAPSASNTLSPLRYRITVVSNHL